MTEKGIRKGNDILVRKLNPSLLATSKELAGIEGISHNEYVLRALREKAAKDMADPRIRPVLEAIRTLRQGIKEQNS